VHNTVAFAGVVMCLCPKTVSNQAVKAELTAILLPNFARVINSYTFGSFTGHRNPKANHVLFVSFVRK
jgi:hypothetical protein